MNWKKTELIAKTGGWSIEVKTMDTYLSKGAKGNISD